MPIYRLIAKNIFPPPELAEPDGLLAVGGDLSPERLLAAYQQGIFPWYSKGDPILWWSPEPRLIFELNSIKISKSLRKIIRQQRFQIRFDTAFREVIESCASIPRRDGRGTWITAEMKRAYSNLHELGYAHSVESWQSDTLVGGLYGVSIGKVFFGESMFSRISDASKVALVALADILKDWQFNLIDCQVSSPHLLRLGAREIDRSEFMERLEHALQFRSQKGKWTKLVWKPKI